METAIPAPSVGTLHVVATPIGNLGDLTTRALDALRAADLVVCEDTRRTAALLRHFGLVVPLAAHHDHNERSSARKLAERIEKEKLRAALVSDAGTPGLSDPGLALVRECLARNVNVIPLPGPSALAAALSVSHLPSDKHLFLGFPPARSAERRRFLAGLRRLPWTLVFYEAPHRALAFLKDLQAVLGEREILLARELTKLHEEVLRGTVSAVHSELANRGQVLGEITILVAADPSAPTQLLDQPAALSPEACLAALDGRGLSRRDLAEVLARLCNLPRNEAYRRAGEAGGAAPRGQHRPRRGATPKGSNSS